MISPQRGLALIYFLHYSTLAILWGGIGFIVLALPGASGIDLVRRLRSAFTVSAWTVLATSIAVLPVQTAYVAGGWSKAVDLDTVWVLGSATSIGHVGILVIFTALALLLAHAAGRFRLTVMLAGAELCELTFSGHAARDTGLVGLGHQLNAAVHSLAGTAWLGALLPFFMILKAPTYGPQARSRLSALRTFSALGHAAVAAVFATGVANVWLVLGHIPADWTSPYEAELIAKITAVSLMTSVALGNRYLVVPRIRAGAPNANAVLAGGCLAEMILGVCVLALVATFGLEDPS